MLSTVDFDDQPSFEADEIDNVAIDRLLPSEPPASQPSIAQQAPQGTFRIRHALAELPCVLNRHPRGVSPSSSFA
jgi:hypothetical protein